MAGSIITPGIAWATVTLFANALLIVLFLPNLMASSVAYVSLNDPTVFSNILLMGIRHATASVIRSVKKDTLSATDW